MTDAHNTVIVTGGGKGLGRAITWSLVNTGYEVIAVDQDAALLEETRSRFPKTIKTYLLDVSDFSAVEDFFKNAPLDRLFGLINNAGVYKGKNLFDYSLDEVDLVVDVNLKGAIFFSKLFGQMMFGQKKSGCIINMSSSSIYGGSDPVYSATKAGLIGLTKACALKFSPYIRVNAIAPGIVKTDILKSIPESVISWYRNSELIKDPLQPNDVANTAEFLLSEKGKNYTGAVFELNNGFHL